MRFTTIVVFAEEQKAASWLFTMLGGVLTSQLVATRTYVLKPQLDHAANK